MPLSFSKIEYTQLNSRQKENYNYHKISSILTDYGFTTLRLLDDWEGADFIAKHISGEHFLVQQKSRLAFAKKYVGKNIHIAFPDGEGGCFLYPHDELLKKVADTTDMTSSDSWIEKRGYTFPWSRVSPELKNFSRSIGSELRQPPLSPRIIKPKGS